MHRLIKVKFGSHLYGTNTPESDTDYKSVHVPNGRQIIMQDFPRVLSQSTGDPNLKNDAGDVDDDSFSLIKYLKMLKDGDMVAIELLFVEKNMAIEMSDEWVSMINYNRKKLIDSNISGFVGYIRKQANKYGIKGSRVATARAAADLFSYWASVGNIVTPIFKKVGDIPTHIIEEFVRNHEHCELIYLPIHPDQPDKLVPFIEILNRKIDFRINITDAYKIMGKLFDEYGSRALAAERGEGVDWKSLYHAIRVSEQALELLQTGSITFPRPNVKDLLAIKRGDYKYEAVSERLENNLKMLEDIQASGQAKVRGKIDTEYMDYVLYDLHLDQVAKVYFG